MYILKQYNVKKLNNENLLYYPGLELYIPWLNLLCYKLLKLKN